jgi:DNA ligase (NAD+)
MIAIEARCALPVNRFIFPLGIRHVSETNARRLGSFEALRAAAKAAFGRVGRPRGDQQ